MLIKKMTRLLKVSGAISRIIPSLQSTFSQYGEDHLIRIILSPSAQGTYVDVGSHHPSDGSNTYGLYLRGWRGLTVDPNPDFRQAYARIRPRGKHLVEGVSETPGSLTYYSFANSVFNTFSERRAAQLADNGIIAVSKSKVTTRPLCEMVEEQLGEQSIDLLSVDCEGLDLEVIRSLGLARRRPTVIIVEDYARLAMFRDGIGHSQLHNYLVDNGYRPFVQLAFSAIYIAEDYRALMRRSSAFDPARIQSGILDATDPM